MKISRKEYDKLPFAVREGALHLWGKALTSYSRHGEFRQVYRFNDFYVETCYQNQHLTCICSFATIRRLEPYIQAGQ